MIDHKDNDERRVDWETVHTIEKQIKRANGYRHVLRATINKSSRQLPDYSVNIGTVSRDGEVVQRNVNIGYVGFFDDAEDVELDDAMDAVLDLWEEAGDWILEQVQETKRQAKEEARHRLVK